MSSSSESTKDTTSRHVLMPIQRSSTPCPHPSGFREVSSHMEFSGRQAEDDVFKVWLDDFGEATTDCGWTDNMRAMWFWFVSGPAKAIWQRTLTTEENKDWKSIVKVFQGQYGVHVNSRSAYQKCNEFWYD